MNFNLKEYNSKKEDIISKIKSTHDWESKEGFILDGLISPKTYATQYPKIICLLGETYGYDESGMVDIDTQLSDDILGVGDPKRQTASKLPSLLWLIFESLEHNSKIDKNHIPNLFSCTKDNTERLQSALSKTAWINVKKASKHIDNWDGGATRQNYNEIYSSTLRNKEILRLQISSLCPDLMIPEFK